MRRLGLRAAVLALLATGMTGPGPATAVSSGAADPLTGAPAAGQCFDLSVRELARASHTEAPVDCAGPNTSEVVAVTVLPDGVGYRDVAKLELVAHQVCRPVIESRAGTTTLGLRLTSYVMGFFVPTKAQRKAGARWLRCDVVRAGGNSLRPLPEATLAVGDFPYPDELSRCLSAKRFLVTSCDRRHVYRAAAAHEVGGKRYPTDREWRRIAGRRCPDVVSSRRFYYTFAGRAAWRTGDRAVVCYSRTRR